MKPLLNRLTALTATSALLAFAPLAESKPAGYVDFGKFAPSSSGEFVEVNLSGGLIKMAAQITQRHEPEVAELLHNIQSVRVNVVGLGDDNRADVTKRVGTIRSELESKGWERIVNAQQKSEDVSVFLKTSNADTVEGLVVTVVEGDKEAVLVNIVGNIKLDQISKIADRLDIEPLKKVGAAVEKKESTDKGPAKESDQK